MALKKKIAVIVGSMRKESFNRKMAHALAKLAPETLELEIVEIKDLPMYNQDLESDFPESWKQFKESIDAADGILFVTPEYNRSLPAVLKNALDIASRPYGKNSWNGKPGGVVSVSISALGGFGANHHLRQCAVYLNIPMMQQPEAYIGKAEELFDENGAIKNEDTENFVKHFIDSYARWVKAHTS
ncbi:MAG: NADPH-dependent oxidoreductase [Sphingobacteriales bacterium]|nr:MAG: NADPH-dependent oxidoreductase [Sphingobacteriales bacterium]